MWEQRVRLGRVTIGVSRLRCATVKDFRDLSYQWKSLCKLHRWINLPQGKGFRNALPLVYANPGSPFDSKQTTAHLTIRKPSHKCTGVHSVFKEKVLQPYKCYVNNRRHSVRRHANQHKLFRDKLSLQLTACGSHLLVWSIKGQSNDCYCKYVTFLMVVLYPIKWSLLFGSFWSDLKRVREAVLWVFLVVL